MIPATADHPRGVRDGLRLKGPEKSNHPARVGSPVNHVTGLDQDGTRCDPGIVAIDESRMTQDVRHPMQLTVNVPDNDSPGLCRNQLQFGTPCQLRYARVRELLMAADADAHRLRIVVVPSPVARRACNARH